MAKSTDKTDKLKDNFLKALELSLGNVTEACKKAKIHRSTFYDWKEKDPDFIEALNYVEEQMLDFVEGKMRERIKGYSHTETKVFNYKGKIITKDVTKHYPPDSGLIAFYLETKGQKRGYIKKQVIDFTKDDPFKDMTEEEIDALLLQMDEDEKKELELMEKLKK